jgi:ABC-2 type transport system ATP-binding protein
MTEAIAVNQLTKIYQGKDRRAIRAVDEIDFTVCPGEVFGFLGPNGAGKTTTIRMLTGLARPTSGSARVLGLDLFKAITSIKKQIGVVPEASNLYDELTAFENLVFSMQLYGVTRQERAERAEDLLQRFRLYDKRDVPFAKLSRGMKRALTIAAGLAHQPPLIFLDEPTTGLDVMSARSLRQTISGLRREGVTVFLTTHYLEEAERLCDRIAILVKGKIVAQDTIERLKTGSRQAKVVEIKMSSAENGLETLRVQADGGVEEAIKQAMVMSAGREVLSINTLQPSLEDIFVQLTGLSAEVMLAEKK